MQRAHRLNGPAFHDEPARLGEAGRGLRAAASR